MKIQFDDKSFIEAKKTDDGKILIIIQAKDHENPLKKITNAVELSSEEFKSLIEGLSI
jgi:nitrate reductase NapAB chaperone NapD